MERGRFLKKYLKYGNYRLQSRNKTSRRQSKWLSVVGLEIHAQINTVSKLFSGSPTSFGSAPNSNVSLFDAAIPGTLPVLNKKCIEAGVITALALSCRVNPLSTFDRKHYFYADLPAGYQITQQRAPLASDGQLSFQVFTPGVNKMPYQKISKIKQIQLEQDSGKSFHDEIEKKSLIDLNRAGIPLMELVFEPDLNDGEEAAALIKELSLILLTIDTCTCKMEEGALRVDANISVSQNSGNLGTRTEIKNIGSVRGVAKAVDFEIERQIEILENGGEIVNETRAWDPTTGVTLPMRDKEVKQDYRFMPEPNLLPLRLNVGGNRIEGLINVEDLRRKVPELPEDTRQKLIRDYGLPATFAIILVNEKQLLTYFMDITKENRNRDPKLVAKILVNELLRIENKNNAALRDGPLNPSVMGEIIDLLHLGSINLVTARNVMEEIAGGYIGRPSVMIEERGWKQIIEEPILREFCKKAIENNPKVVSTYLSGKQKVFSSLVGYIADISNKRANLAIATRLLKEMLEDMRKKNVSSKKETLGA